MLAFIWLVAGVSCADVDLFNNSVYGAFTDTPSNGSRVTDVEMLNDNVVETDIGPVRGYKDGNFFGYFDIPYGTFSVNNPFEAPTPSPPLAAEHAKTEHTSKCPQINSENRYIGSQDCLTLSIFVPENAQNADVLFHIHDNSLNDGSGDPLKYGPRHLASQGVILILPNYRIGSLGFLCLRNQTVPGNAGLKDLYLALQWVKRNIGVFGANDSNIVVSGSGVAGALVEYLVLANDSRPLISKAIIESGFALSPWALDRVPLETAHRLLTEINSNDTINFLERLVRAGQGLTFLPCVENERGFITGTPWELLSRDKLEIAVMSGTADQPAMDVALALTEEDLSEINQNFTVLLPNDLKFNTIDEKNSIGRQVKTQYFGEINITANDMERLSRCYSDSQYLYPGLRGARLLVRRGATVYFYEFSHGNSHAVNGSAKGDILNYVFSKDGENGENRMQTIVTTLWTTFIKTGKPSFEDIEWTDLKAVQDTEEVWLSIGNEVLVRRGFHQARLKIWDDIYRRHFVERNVALIPKSSICIILLSSIFLLDITYHFKF